MTRTTAAALAACLVAAVAVTGCTSSSTPKANYSTAVSSSPASATTSSPAPAGIPTTGPNVQPGETPPTLGAGAETGTPEGAQAFELYYVRLVDWVYATSRPEMLAPWYARECSNCQDFLSNLRQQIADGRHYEGARLTVGQLGLVSNDGRRGATYAVSALVHAAPLTIRSADGTVTKQGPATDLTITNWLRPQDGVWQIVDQGQA